MPVNQKIKIRVGGDFDPLPADKYTCQIADVTLVEQFNKFKAENQQMLNYKFVVLTDNELVKVPEEFQNELTKDKQKESTRGRFLWKRCSMSMHQKSWLYKLTKAVYGRELTKKEQEEFDPNALIGKQVDVMTEQSVGQDGITVYSNIVSFTANKKPLTPIVAEIPTGKSTESKSAFQAPTLNEENLTLEEVLGE